MLLRALCLLAITCAASIAAAAQKPAATPVPAPVPAAVRGSGAFAVVLLRKSEVLADLEAYTNDYTDANPKMLDLKAELASLERSIARLATVNDPTRLTESLGRMMVRKAAYEADLSHLTRSYNKDYPEVRRAQKRVDYFEAAINEILK